MFNITFKASKFLMKHMWLYYILNYTWGLLTVLVGWIVYLFIIIFMRKKIVERRKFGPCFYLIFGNKWGGLTLGKTIFIADKMIKLYTQHVKEHECGHTFQNAIWGPLAIFLIYIPSVIRYIMDLKGKLNKPYDSIWFEGNASTIGNFYYENYLKEKENNV